MSDNIERGDPASTTSTTSRKLLFRNDTQKPQSHFKPTAEVKQLLELGMALGHKRFELVSLAGRDAAGSIAAHAWAEARDDEAELVFSVRQTTRSAVGTSSHDRPASGIDRERNDVKGELQREVECLRERVENLSRELRLARRDSARLAKLLKKEEDIGGEQRKRADEAVQETRALREELDRLKQAYKSRSTAARSALSDAHERSVLMAERRRRQQAESLMQAYKGLYEDQLQTQYASSESYHSLTRGYSRLSNDNKSLRRIIAASTAAASTDSPSTVCVEHGAETVAENGGSPLTDETGTIPGNGPGASDISLAPARDGNGVENVVKESAVTVAAEAVATATEVAAVCVSDAEIFSYSETSTTRGGQQEYGRASKDEISPTGTTSTPETHASSPLDFIEASAVAETVPTERQSITRNGGERPVIPPTVGNSVGKGKVYLDDARSDGTSCSSAAFAFPMTGVSPSASWQQAECGQGGEEKTIDPLFVDAKPKEVAAPNFELASRWQGRPVPYEINTPRSASFPEFVGAPKKSDSPRALGWRRCGTHAEDLWGWGDREGNVSAEKGFTRIEPLRPHSI